METPLTMYPILQEKNEGKFMEKCMTCNKRESFLTEDDSGTVIWENEHYIGRARPTTFKQKHSTEIDKMLKKTCTDSFNYKIFISYQD